MVRRGAGPGRTWITGAGRALVDEELAKALRDETVHGMTRQSSRLPRKERRLLSRIARDSLGARVRHRAVEIGWSLQIGAAA